MFTITNYASEIHIFSCFCKYLFKNQFLEVAPPEPIFLESQNTLFFCSGFAFQHILQVNYGMIN